MSFPFCSQPTLALKPGGTLWHRGHVFGYMLNNTCSRVDSKVVDIRNYGPFLGTKVSGFSGNKCGRNVE